MPRRLLSLPAILAVGFVTSIANAAEKSQYQCRSGDVVRRVIIEVGDLATSLPCEVVYFKDTEAPGVRRVLWNARSDAAFCDAKAAGLVDKLATSGWQCDASGQAASAAQPAAPPQPEIAAAPNAATAAATVPSLDAATVGSEIDRTESAIASRAPELSTEAVITPATPQLSEPAAATQTAALEPADSAPTEELTEQLQGVIEQNLTSLNKSVDGDFRAEVGQFGDLNADGLNDAVVFFNYQSNAADFTQFVAAYLFNGNSYHLAATKPVGGTDRAVERVEIESIVDGAIQLKLHLNDASQTEYRSAAMTLKEGQLIEIE